MKKFISINILLAGIALFATAQKLPKIQEVSLRAPANIKIDGKTTEWDDQFQAYNWGNHIYYTISNDDDNLYLTTRMDDVLGSRKVVNNGLTFTIIPLSKKDDELSITFPAISKSIMDSEVPGGTPLLRYNSLIKAKTNTAANKAKIDSLIASANNAMGKDFKQIYITGMPGINDPLLSIYNTQGIMVGASYDKNMNYSYELAIPLKYLQAALTDAKSLKYNIKLNGIPPIIMKRAMAMPPHVVAVAPGPPRAFSPPSLEDQFHYGTTEFSGEYTLALKP